MYASSPYAFGVGPRTAVEVLLYDSEALSTASTFSALMTATRYGLCERTFGPRPVLWWPTNKALDMRSELEDRFLDEVE